MIKEAAPLDICAFHNKQLLDWSRVEGRKMEREVLECHVYNPQPWPGSIALQ